MQARRPCYAALHPASERARVHVSPAVGIGSPTSPHPHAHTPIQEVPMRPIRWAAGAVLAVVVAAGALAQGQPGVAFDAYGDPWALLQRPEVQADLKLTGDQKKSVMEARQ